MTAKDRHILKIVEYIGNWDNNFPSRTKMAEICGVKQDTLRKHFTLEEYAEIESKGLELRKKNSAKQRGAVYKSMLKEAKGGNVPAQKEFLDRTEGKVTEKREVTGKDGKKLRVEHSLDESWKELLEAVTGDNTDELPNDNDHQK